MENREDFDLELRFIGQVNQSGVVLQPNKATVTIIDDGKPLPKVHLKGVTGFCNSITSSSIDAVIGFIDAPYTVSEGDGSALLQVGLIEGSIQGEVIIALSTNDSTAVGTSVINSTTKP